MVEPRANTERITAALIAAAPDLPYFRVDADRNVVEVSAAMERLTGFEADDVLGRSCLRLHRCEECLRGCGVFDHGVVQNKRLELIRADGTTIPVSKSGYVTYDEDGEIGGAVEVVRPLEETDESASPESREAARIRAALEQARYDRTRAARLLGMSRTTLWRRMNKYGL